MTRPHKPLAYMDVCERCGATGVEIMDGLVPRDCAAPDNVTSLRARQMKRQLDEILAPAIAALKA